MLANYFIRSPFKGILASLDIKKGDTVSQSNEIATILTEDRIATISLNEVDVAQVKSGQKVLLKFDALPDLNVRGEVALVDTIGAVTQGVVTYNVQIKFNANGVDIKPGMSVSAIITNESKENALIIPSSAIKQDRGTKYVEVLTPDALSPIKKEIEIGLENDTESEILSGLKAGEKVVTQTITGSSNTSTSSTGATNSGIRVPGVTGQTGGAPRGNILRF